MLCKTQMVKVIEILNYLINFKGQNVLIVCGFIHFDMLV